MAGLLIIGASGYLGSELARHVPDAAGTFHRRRVPAGIQLDVCDGAAVDRVVRELQPEAVINTAYLQSGDGAREVNEAGAQNVARAAAAAGARLVHVSTDLVFDGTLGRPYEPDDSPTPVMEYGRQKLKGEEVVRAAHPEALIVRTSLIYGGPSPSPHERLALDAADGRAEVSFFTDELRSPAPVGPLAAELVRLSEGSDAGARHVAGADGVSRLEFASLVVAAAGGDPGRLRSGLAAEHPDPRPLDCRLASDPVLPGVREVLG